MLATYNTQKSSLELRRRGSLPDAAMVIQLIG